ncbi:hypothetical protein [Fructobacillus parabroussonetiae]|nr:hypothetical protein [Fructobacillus parabroussonetiae]
MDLEAIIKKFSDGGSVDSIVVDNIWNKKSQTLKRRELTIKINFE